MWMCKEVYMLLLKFMEPFELNSIQIQQLLFEIVINFSLWHGLDWATT